MPTIEWLDANRISATELRGRLATAGIDARPVFPSLSSLPLFDQSAATCLVARRFATRAINLPSYHDMSESDIARVCAAVTEALAD